MAESSSQLDFASVFDSFNKEVLEMSTKNIRKGPLKLEIQLERLTTETFRNPFDVLLLTGDASDDEIKRQYKTFSVLLHPDKCSDPRGKDAFMVVEHAYKTLLDPLKRKIYVRIMKEAKERTERQRAAENKKRVKANQAPLPEDTFEAQYRETLKQIFDEIDEKRIHYARLQQSQKVARQELIETKTLVEQYKVLTEDEWDKKRQERVNTWRDFSAKKHCIGTKNSDKGIRKIDPKIEERTHQGYNPGRNDGAQNEQEGYKRTWR